MKAVLSLQTLAFFMLASLLFSAPGCTGDKDDDNSKTLCELLEGEWEVTSYEVDGDDLMGVDIEELIMEFEDGDCEGDFTWSFVYEGGFEDTASGDYSIDEEDEEITLNIDGDEITLDLEVDDDELEISGTPDGGFAISIKAERQ